MPRVFPVPPTLEQMPTDCRKATNLCSELQVEIQSPIGSPIGSRSRIGNSPVRQRCAAVDYSAKSCAPLWARWAWRVLHAHAHALPDKWIPDAGGRAAPDVDLQ